VALWYCYDYLKTKDKWSARIFGIKNDKYKLYCGCETTCLVAEIFVL